MKQLINGYQVNVNQLMPIKYNWAWEHYLNGCANHWMPSEVPMAKDLELWRGSQITPAERRMIKLNLGFFSTAESLVGNNLVLAIFKHITNAECRQYLLRQAFEEAIHTHAFLYIVESLGLDEQEIFGMYHDIPSIKDKDQFEMLLTEELINPTFISKEFTDNEMLVKNLIRYYVIMEGIFFYSGFAMILSLHRRNLMTGIGQQFQYILRDETIHLNFGIDLINGIKAENPEVWNDDFIAIIQEDIKCAVALESAYAQDCLQEPVQGIELGEVLQYIEYIATRRSERIGLPALYQNVKNPFPWLSETIDLPKEKNFFETTVTEYRSGATLDWEE